MSPGRPPIYTLELAEYICQQLAEGRSLKAICAEENMPVRTTVYKWLDESTDFADMYARARARQAETMLDEILEIADDSSNDTVITDFGPRPDAEWISRSKLRVDARKWAMSKLAPKKYGDSKQLDLTSGGKRVTGFTIIDYTDDDSEA